MKLKSSANVMIPSSVVPYLSCCAKTCPEGGPGTTVYDHCRYSGVVADKLVRLCSTTVRSKLPKCIGCCVSFHDIGKVSPGFQWKYFSQRLSEIAPDWVAVCRNGGVNPNHAEVGAEAYRALFSLERSDAVVRAIASHHGKVMEPGRNCDGEAWQSERKKLVDALQKYFGHAGPFNEKNIDSRLLTGLTCVADWISSDEQYFPPEEGALSENEAECRALTALETAGFVKTEVLHSKKFGDVFGSPGQIEFVPRVEQRALIEMVDVPGVYVMESTMGSGKTEAALFAAYKMIDAGYNNGIYFALPTRLTSDRIYLRMQKFINRISGERVPVRLSHGRAWLDGYKIGGVCDDEEAGTARGLPSWFAPSKRGLLYPYAVGTIDQALLSVMNVKHSFVRLFGLAGKVVILDEVHSYDMYTGSLVDELVHELLKVGCTVIILSATLTKAKRDTLLGVDSGPHRPYPLVSSTRENGYVCCEPKATESMKRVELRRIVGSVAVVKDALSRAREGCNVLCVANTVRKAQEWFVTLKSEMNQDDVESIKIGLLHSRFPAFRRSELEDEWMDLLGKDGGQRPHGSILIATQIVEQSVDIDADYLITEVAPIDMLLQRIGRLWRHDRSERPTAEPTLSLAFDHDFLANGEFSFDEFKRRIGPGSCCVYAPYVLLCTLRMLEGRDHLVVPEEIRELIEGVYAEVTEPGGSAAEEMKLELEEDCAKMKALAQSASARVTSCPAMSDSDDNPPTRYGSRKMVNLLIVRECDRGVGKGVADMVLLNRDEKRISSVERDFTVTKALYENVVSVPARSEIRGRSPDCELLSRHFHDSEMPWICRIGVGGHLVIDATGDDTGLEYRDGVGVFDGSLVILDEDKGTGASVPNIDFIEGADW